MTFDLVCEFRCQNMLFEKNELATTNVLIFEWGVPNQAARKLFPFIKFPGVDTILGPEMKSTGEVMGVKHICGSVCEVAVGRIC